MYVRVSREEAEEPLPEQVVLADEEADGPPDVLVPRHHRRAEQQRRPQLLLGQPVERHLARLLLARQEVRLHVASATNEHGQSSLTDGERQRSCLPTGVCVYSTHRCNQRDGFHAGRVIGSQGEGDDAAHGVADQVEGGAAAHQAMRLDEAPLDRLHVVSHSVHAVRRLGAPAEAEEIHREQPAVVEDEGGLPEHRPSPPRRTTTT